MVFRVVDLHSPHYLAEQFNRNLRLLVDNASHYLKSELLWLGVFVLLFGQFLIFKQFLGDRTQVSLSDWGFRMILPKLNKPQVNHLLHLLQRRVNPPTFRHLTRLASKIMNYVISWSTTPRPRNISIAPRSKFINVLKSTEVLGGVTICWAL